MRVRPWWLVVRNSLIQRFFGGEVATQNDFTSYKKVKSRFSKLESLD